MLNITLLVELHVNKIPLCMSLNMHNLLAFIKPNWASLGKIGAIPKAATDRCL